MINLSNFKSLSALKVREKQKGKEKTKSDYDKNWIVILLFSSPALVDEHESMMWQGGVHTTTCTDVEEKTKEDVMGPVSIWCRRDKLF